MFEDGHEEDWDGDRDDDEEEEEEEARESPSQEEDGSQVEVEEGEEDLMVPTKPDFQPCPEDDDFMAALDKMVSENIAESKNIVRDKSQLSGLTVPVGGGKGKKNWEQLQQESTEG